MFILSAVHLPLATVLSDVCNYVDTINVTGSVRGQGGVILNACLYNLNLIDVYNLQSQLNFTSQVVFPSFQNPAQKFSFSQLNTMQTQIASLTPASFGTQSGSTFTSITALGANCGANIAADLTTLNTLTNGCGDSTTYTAGNCLATNSCYDSTGAGTISCTATQFGTGSYATPAVGSTLWNARACVSTPRMLHDRYLACRFTRQVVGLFFSSFLLSAAEHPREDYDFICCGNHGKQQAVC